MVDQESKVFGTGAIKDSYDPRDYTWKEIGFGSTPFNWNTSYDIEEVVRAAIKDKTFHMKAKDQNGSGSCGGQAWSYLSAVLEAIATGTYEERSAKYIYAQTFVPPGGGSNARDNSKIITEQGCCRESVLTSYNNGEPPTEDFMRRTQDITQEAKNDATVNRVRPYSVVESNIDSFAQAIRDNNGIVFGIDGQNNGTWTSKFPKPPTKNEWAHWVFGGKVKMIDGVKHIGILNSWGNVGDKGWQWIGEDYFLSGHVWYGYTHTYNPDSVAVGFKHTFNIDLELGMSSDEVQKLQTALQVDGCFPATIKPTKYFGTITQAAVRKFQEKHNVANWFTPGYGRCGPKTRAALNKIFS